MIQMDDIFKHGIARIAACAPIGSHVAAAVSGGPDSMAMLWLLSQWAKDTGQSILAVTVDHGLRENSANEARQVSDWVRHWPCVTHKILTWDGVKPKTRILETARSARYDLIASEMMANGTNHLFIAHHQDDQAETFLIRLSKGSGLDGLACMREAQTRGDITLVRPLLGVSKRALVDLCDANAIPYVRDPTNVNETYLRPRLRAAQDVLEREGLNAKRLSTTASRLARASFALDKMARDLAGEAAVAGQGHETENTACYDFAVLRNAPEELFLRVVSAAIEAVGGTRAGRYPPRLERVEALCDRLIHDGTFSRATLGGCKISLDANRTVLRIERE